MVIFFELLSKKIGFSRIGRFPKSKSIKKPITTPQIIIPFDFSLDDHNLYILSEKHLEKSNLFNQPKEICWFFTHSGTLEVFQEVLVKKLDLCNEYNIIPIIPFNIPTTTIGKGFAEQEIEKYLDDTEKVLKEYSNLNFGLTIKLFNYPDYIDKYIPLIQNNENIRILNLADIFDNLNNFRGIIQAITKIKQQLDNNLVIMVSGRIVPKYYPILVYLGVDIIDSSYLLYLSAENFYDTIEYLLPVYKLKDLPCPCLACRSELSSLKTEKYSSKKIQLLCRHNIITAKTYINKIIQYLNYEDYRAFVEKTALNDNHIISLLKILDRNYFEILRNETPIIQESKQINSLGSSSYNRPDFQLFRERLVDRFKPETWTKIIVLLPCSAKKPYSESKSHKKFLNILKKFPEFGNIQEIIITSPLGAIPRQLENIYPVNSYDISVTGVWDEQEIEIASKMLIKLLNMYHEDIPVITHLDDTYDKILSYAASHTNHVQYSTNIIDGHTSEKSLLNLEEKLRECIPKYTPKEDYVNFANSWTRKFVKILDYQFGLGSGAKIIRGGVKTKTDKRNNQIKIFDPISQNLLLVFKFSSGQIALTIKGAERLSPIEEISNFIVFDGEKIRGNTLFRPGILEVSPNLSPKDYAVIFNKDKSKVIGMAHLIVGAESIKNSKTGKVAEIYEKLR